MGNTSKLWTPGFVKVCFGNLLLFISLYMLLPVFPLYLVERTGVGFFTAGSILALFALSMFLFGPFFNYLVDTYKRKSICLMSLLAVVAVLAGYPLMAGVAWVVVLRILQGMFTGMAMMTIGSTLAIDITASTRRSEANTTVARFGRMGMAFGPMIGIFVYQTYGFDSVFFVSGLMAAAIFLFMLTVHVPFRAPIGSAVCSTDRFLLLKGWLLAVNLILITAVLGIVLVAVNSMLFYLFMGIGILLAMVANSLVFAEADMKSRIVSGLILLVAALLLLATHEEQTALITSALLTGIGVGLASFHFLLMLIRISEHCQRGTANTTYAFSWEVGIALGMWVACGLKEYFAVPTLLYTGVGFSVMAMMVYLAFSNNYFIKHKRK